MSNNLSVTDQVIVEAADRVCERVDLAIEEFKKDAGRPAVIPPKTQRDIEDASQRSGIAAEAARAIERNATTVVSLLVGILLINFVTLVLAGLVLFGRGVTP